MKYNAPIGYADPNDPYVDGNPGTGTEGSPVPAAAIEHTQREIVNVIIAAGLVPNEADLTQLTQAISALSVSVPVAAMMFWPKNTPPSGWLERDGSAISRTVYADLFAAIGTDYGVGDGATTFNIPDDRGLFERGWDNSAGVDTGRVFGSYQDDELEAHTHTVPTQTGSNGGSAGNINDNNSEGSAGVDVITGSTGGTETRPKNRAYLPIIKY